MTHAQVVRVRRLLVFKLPFSSSSHLLHGDKGFVCPVSVLPSMSSIHKHLLKEKNGRNVYCSVLSVGKKATGQAAETVLARATRKQEQEGVCMTP